MNKATFSANGANKLEALREQVKISFGKKGRVVEVDQMFSSKTKQTWECECGKRSHMEEQFCPKCFHDIYGFRQKETRPEYVADSLARKASILRGVLSNDVADLSKAHG